MEAFHARDPYVPSEQIKNNMPAPLVRLMDGLTMFEMYLTVFKQSHEELQSQKASLNQDHYRS